jgi:hypothetical protein
MNMRKPNTDDINDFVAKLAKQNSDRIGAFLDRLTDAERNMTVGEFCELNTDTPAKFGGVQSDTVIFM